VTLVLMGVRNNIRPGVPSDSGLADCTAESGTRQVAAANYPRIRAPESVSGGQHLLNARCREPRSDAVWPVCEMECEIDLRYREDGLAAQLLTCPPSSGWRFTGRRPRRSRSGAGTKSGITQLP
jgi:hypothetical protein